MSNCKWPDCECANGDECKEEGKTGGDQSRIRRCHGCAGACGGAPLTPSEAAEILRLHNIWRRWDFDEDQPAMIDPKTIGEAIDVVVSELSRNGESDRR